MIRASVIMLMCLLTAACSDDTVPAASNDTPDAGDCFFCVDGGDQEDDAGDKPDAEGDKPDGEGDKPDDGDKEALNFFVGDINLTDRAGTYAYTEFTDDGKDPICFISYEIIGFTDEEDCDECSFAHSFTVGAIVEELNPEECAEGLGQDGKTLAFGHGPPSDKGNTLLGEFDGVWKAAGFSFLDGDQWNFFAIVFTE